MLEFRKDMRKATSRPSAAQLQSNGQPNPSNSVSSRAAQAQNSGFARVNALMRQLSAESEALSNGRSVDSEPGGANPPTDSAAEREMREREEDERLVDNELRKYIDEGLTEEGSNFDLLKYWEVSLGLSVED